VRNAVVLVVTALMVRKQVLWPVLVRDSPLNVVKNGVAKFYRLLTCLAESLPMLVRCSLLRLGRISSPASVLLNVEISDVRDCLWG
jgi:hypothetical protein